MANLDNSATRRTFLGAAVAIPTIALSGGAIAATAAASANGAQWYSLKAKYDKAKARAATADAHHDETWGLAQAEIGPEPDLTYTIPGLANVFDAKRDMGQLSTPGSGLFPQAIKDELKAKWEKYTAARERVERKYRLNELERACDVACNAASEIWSQLLKMPSPDMAALLWKIEELFGGDNLKQDSCDCWDNGIVLPMVADARRFLSNGRA